MSIETRDLETRYFSAAGSTVIRVERVRGQFDAYDGSFETLNVSWWLESLNGRQAITQAEIRALITDLNEFEPVGLANYFADANDLGNVISENYTSFIDFVKSFGRDKRDVFPRLDDDILRFTTSKSFGEPIVTESEFYDVAIDLQSQQIENTMFWSGNRRELVIAIEPPNDG